MSVFVQISSKLLNILLPKLVLWCIIISWSVIQKDWFAIFKVKFTARAYMIRIWWFLLYLLNCWSICYHTWFDSTLSLTKAHMSFEEIGLLCSRSRSQQILKCQWMFVQSVSLNSWAFYYQTWYSNASARARVSSKKMDWLSSRTRSKSKYNFLIYLLNFWSFATKLGLMLVSWCFKPIQPQRIMSGLRELVS